MGKICSMCMVGRWEIVVTRGHVRGGLYPLKEVLLSHLAAGDHQWRLSFQAIIIEKWWDRRWTVSEKYKNWNGREERRIKPTIMSTFGRRLPVTLLCLSPWFLYWKEIVGSCFYAPLPSSSLAFAKVPCPIMSLAFDHTELIMPAQNPPPPPSSSFF